MKSKKLLGIWMDHSVANLMELSNNSIGINTIESKPDLQLNPEDLYFKDESHMLNKEQALLSSYYKKLSDVIFDFDEVVIFGPTDAKNELHNMLKNNQKYEKTKIEVLSADKMSENQQHAFVKDYFQKGPK